MMHTMPGLMILCIILLSRLCGCYLSWFWNQEHFYYRFKSFFNQIDGNNCETRTRTSRLRRSRKSQLTSLPVTRACFCANILGVLTNETNRTECGDQLAFTPSSQMRLHLGDAGKCKEPVMLTTAAANWPERFDVQAGCGTASVQKINVWRGRCKAPAPPPPEVLCAS